MSCWSGPIDPTGLAGPGPARLGRSRLWPSDPRGRFRAARLRGPRCARQDSVRGPRAPPGLELFHVGPLR
eukprot:130288-Pyramimonas_sp.AAC.1